MSEAERLYREILQLPRQSGASLQVLAACGNLGNVLMELGRLDEAITCYLQVLEREPEYADGYYNLGNALVGLERVDEALIAYRRALELEPGFVEVYNNLGVALTRLGRYEEALSAYDTAAGLEEPRFEKPLANKAALLLETGQTEQALQAVEAALKVNPRSAGAWLICSGLKHFAPDDPDVEAMEALLAAYPGPAMSVADSPRSRDRISLEFALGKAWMDIGDTARAFAHFDQGNRLQRATFTYDSKATDGWMAAMAGAFTAELLQKLQGVGYPSHAPIFVVGMPRSGTTLVEQLLASHPEVHGAGELTTLEEIAARISGGAPAGCPAGDPQQLAALLPEDYVRLGREYVTHVCSLAPGKSRVIDKMPTNFLYVGFIHALLPNARIIHCRRDPLDTCLSCYTKFFPHVQFASELSELGTYYRGYATLMGHWRRLLSPECFIEVRYEDVVQDCEAQARRLVEFCGLPWDAGCLRFHANPRPIRTASVSQVRQPIYRSSIGRWKPYAPHLGPLLAALQLHPVQ